MTNLSIANGSGSENDDDDNNGSENSESVFGVVKSKYGVEDELL